MAIYGKETPGIPAHNDAGGLSRLEGVFRGEVDVKYVFIQGRADSGNLAVGFSDIPEKGTPPGYQYVKDLAGIDCHKLFILDDFGARASYYACRGRRFDIERSVAALISKIITRNEIETVLSFGLGAGASAALYYGFKYGFDHVIAASPQYYIGGYLHQSGGMMDIFEFMSGGRGEADKAFLNKILQRAIASSGSTPIIHLIYSKKGDIVKDHIAPLIKNLDQYEMRYVLDVQNNLTDGELAGSFPEKLRNLVAKCFRYPQISVRTSLENGQYTADVTCADRLSLGYELFADQVSVIRTPPSFRRSYSFQGEQGKDYTLKVTAFNPQGNVRVETVRFEHLFELPVAGEYAEPVTEDFTKPLAGEGHKPGKGQSAMYITDDLTKLFEEIDEQYDGGIFTAKNTEEVMVPPPPPLPEEPLPAQTEQVSDTPVPVSAADDRQTLREYLNGATAPELFDFDFNIRYPLKRWSDTREICLDVAELALKGEYRVYTSIDPSRPQTTAQLWTDRVEPAATYCAYLYSLTVVSRLINACRHTGDDRYFQKALELVTSFVDFVHSDGSENALRLWHEFSVAGRIMALTEFAAVSAQLNKAVPPAVLSAIKEQIVLNVIFLLGDVYTQNNQGLWQNNALLAAALALKNNAYVSQTLNAVALSRLIDQINGSFTGDGVQNENSSFYHFYNLNIIKKTRLFLENNNIDVPGLKQSLVDFFVYAEAAGGHFIRQDKRLPFDGDTESRKYKDREFIPESAFFRDSHLAILKDQKAYILTRAGNKSLAHKHRDDMALTFFYDNREFILDAGKYHCEHGSKERAYVLSALAHSTLVVDDSDYPLKKSPDCDILSAGEQPGCAWVKMYNNQYEGVKLTRTLIWLASNLIFLSDHCESEQEHKYTQNYLLSDFAEIQRYDQGIIMETDDAHLSIRQMDGEPHNCRIFRGDNQTLRGKVSYKRQQMTDRYNVAFEKTCRQTSFYTCIEVHTGVPGEFTLDSIEVDGDSYAFTCLDADGKQSFFSVDA